MPRNSDPADLQRHPSAPTEDWFQEALQIPKLTDTQVPWCALHTCGSTTSVQTNLRYVVPCVFRKKKNNNNKSAYTWTQAVQTHLIQGSMVYTFI